MHIFDVVSSRAVLGLIALGFVLAGCDTLGYVDPGPVQTSAQTVETGNATSVSAKINVNTQAKLTIHDGADSLLNGRFTFNESLKPGVSYSVDGTSGTLEITQPAARNLDYHKLNNVWDLEFGSAVPVDLTTDVTTGSSRIDISSMKLTSLDSATTSGSLDAIVSGNQERLQHVVAKSSSGQVGIDLGGTFPSLASVSVKQTSGNVRLTMDGDFGELSSLDTDTTSGNTTIYVAGSWAHDLTSSIQTVSGNVTLTVPSDVGVRVTASVTPGKVNANGFRIDNGAYVNDAYGTSAVTLQFDIHVTSGNVNLNLSH